VLPLHKSLAIFLFFLLLSIATYGFLKDVSGVPSNWMPNDKVMHVLVFFALTLSFIQAFIRPFWQSFLLLALYGALIEVAQATFTSRMGDPFDWLADIAGVLGAALLVRYLPAHWFNRSLVQS
jgi:VanZ family protein